MHQLAQEGLGAQLGGHLPRQLRVYRLGSDQLRRAVHIPRSSSRRRRRRFLVFHVVTVILKVYYGNDAPAHVGLQTLSTWGCSL